MTLQPSNRNIKSNRVRFDSRLNRWTDLKANASPWVANRITANTPVKGWY